MPIRVPIVGKTFFIYGDRTNIYTVTQVNFSEGVDDWRNMWLKSAETGYQFGAFGMEHSLPAWDAEYV